MEIEIPDLDDIEFERECECCYGKGVFYKTTVPCTVCGGADKYVTPAGRTLGAFLKKYYNLEPNGVTPID
jgi:hypothetical protein